MNYKMRKIMQGVMLLAVSTTVLAGCGSAENEAAPTTSAEQATADTTATAKGNEEKIKLVFGTNKTNFVDTTLRELADEFSAAHPNVTIDIEGYQEPNQIIKTRAAAGELPDLAIVAQDMTSKDFANYYLPIDDMGYTSDQMYAYETGLGDDGKLYAIPCSISYEGLVYNKKAFKDAGIEKVPVTMEEFYVACEKLKAAGIIPLAINFKDMWPLDWYGNNAVFALASTGDPAYRNNLVNTPLFSDDEGLYKGFQMLLDMNQKGYLEPDLMSSSWENFTKDHAQGKAAMAYMGTWYPIQMVQNGAAREDVGMFPFPGSKAVVQAADYRYAIAKTSKHPEMAKEFMKFLWEDDRFAKATGILSPLKASPIEDSTVAELLSYNFPMVIADPIDAKMTQLLSASEIDLNVALQEYLTSDKPDGVIEKYNQKWEQAK